MDTVFMVSYLVIILIGFVIGIIVAVKKLLEYEDKLSSKRNEKCIKKKNYLVIVVY